MQEDLFGPSESMPPSPSPSARKRTGEVGAIVHSPEMIALAAGLPVQLRMGVSTWSYPGWEGLVWDKAYHESILSRKGLGALSAHPLMRTVCVDRSFWRPLSTEQYAQMALQIPPDFRFVVKCPNVITDAWVRSEEGKGQRHNPCFLESRLAIEQFVTPALQGLGDKLGVLVYQLSPLPFEWLHDPHALFARLSDLLAATRLALQDAPHIIVAVEVRDPSLLGSNFAQTLKSQKATMCLGLHGKMPVIDEQLQTLRKLWPTPLVCRWNLNRSFGPVGYPLAQEKHQPFNEIRTPDLHTRTVLARTIHGICGAGQAAYVTVSNDAEGCAPKSIALLAQALTARHAHTSDID